MSDSLPTIWEADPHTCAKHHIFRKYLDAWIPIMAHQMNRTGTTVPLQIVDAFAGSGVYVGGIEGSPVLALRAVLEHTHDLPLVVKFLFIEKDAARYQSLSTIMEDWKARTPQSGRVAEIIVKHGDCGQILAAEIDSWDKLATPIGPAFFFLDQFGYSDVPMQLVQRIMCHRMWEAFTYLNWDHMNRFLSDDSKWPSITTAFGGNEWKAVTKLPPTRRAAFMLKTYKDALRERAKARYVWPFAMHNDTGRLIYWLFFCTNHPRGLEEMKKAMWRVDDSGQFRFSDRDDPQQGHFFSECDDAYLAEEIRRYFAGQERTITEVAEFVLTDTPGVRYKRALKKLEKDGRLEARNPLPGRRIYTFADDSMRVRFT